MKNTADFMKRLMEDEAFAKEVNDKMKAVIEGDSADKKQALVDIGAEYGYEIAPDDLKELSADNDVLSEEELGKVSGGTLPVITILGATLSFCIVTDVVQSILDS